MKFSLLVSKTFTLSKYPDPFSGCQKSVLTLHQTVNWGNVPFDGWTCDQGSIVMENGDYAVPQGAKCSPVCPEGKRVDSLFSSLTCTRPIDADYFDTAEWHDMLDKKYS